MFAHPSIGDIIFWYQKSKKKVKTDTETVALNQIYDPQGQLCWDIDQYKVYESQIWRSVFSVSLNEAENILKFDSWLWI